MAMSSTWTRTTHLALPCPSMTPGRWLDKALSTETGPPQSGAMAISLAWGGLPRFIGSSAAGINDAGQAGGISFVSPPLPTPEPSTWAMMLAGFAGLGYAGYRRARE